MKAITPAAETKSIHYGPGPKGVVMYAKLKLSNVKQRHSPRGRPNRLPQNPQAEITLFLRRMRFS